MKISRNSILSAASFLAVLCAGSFASAETVCQDLWTVKPLRAAHALALHIVEKNQQGPACDLVIESFSYDEADQSLSLRIRPVSFCPLDAIEARRAQLVWALPFALRQGGELRLLINERETGSLKFERTSATFDGGCQ